MKSIPLALIVALSLPVSACSVMQGQQNKHDSAIADRSSEEQHYCNLPVSEWMKMPDAKKIYVFNTVANVLADKAKNSNPAFSEQLRAWLTYGNGRDNFDREIEEHIAYQTKSMLSVMVGLAYAYKDVLDQMKKSQQNPR